ncbi:Hypothetical predicted protein [Paramuricea clavata]|uniref:Uncharacterized protein n=1 Tax=Paramuricea clavata TaxID=317549 RepID=A0A7D9L4Q2_PARCT|nr:Hypothetical predicted protein [Paramuricea clavata]
MHQLPVLQQLLKTFNLNEPSCKNTCSRLSGRKKRGCPCRDENLHCTDKCSCGSKKSKNQEQSTANANAGKNAFDRHQAAIEVSNREITVSKASVHTEF